MGEDLDPLVVQRTQQKLGKYIQKPQLTDKLLRRPPFRFLHDIVTSAIKQYGVFEGIFTKQELVSDNLKEKEDKVAFLQKLISSIAAETGEELSVRPSKIVAGSETQKTNELLQALATVLENKHQNGKTQKTSNKLKPSVGDLNSTKLSNGESNSTPTRTVKPSNGNTGSKAPAISSVKKAVDSRPKELPTKASTVKPEAKPAAKTKEANGSSTITQIAASSKPTPQTTKTVPAASKPVAKSEQPKKLDQHKQPVFKGVGKEVTPTSKTQAPESAVVRNKVAIPMEYIPVPPDESASNVDDELQPVKDTPTGSGSFRRNSITGPQQLSPELASSDSGITMEHPLSATLHGSRSARDSGNIRHPPAEDDGIDADEGHAVDDDNETREKSAQERNLPNQMGKLSPPRSALQNSFEKPMAVRNSSPPMASSSRPLSNRPPSGNTTLQRPKSSRRPPSRTLRDRLSVIRQDSSRPISGQVPRVIVEGNTLSDDEEDRIVQAAVLDQAAADLTRSGFDELIGSDQGKLVEEILSAQRELDPFTDTEAGTKDSSSASMEVQHLKNLMQQMAQSALPLGQLIPLIHEDMEIMQEEWQVWKREADSLEEEYNRERAAADRSVEKLQVELEELERAVRDQEARLNAARASVLRGESDVSLVISSIGRNR